MKKLSPSDDPVEVSGEADFLPGASVLMVTTDEPSRPSSTPLVKQMGSNSSGVMNWGNSNNYPQEIIGLANQSPEILALLDFYHTTLYGGGLYYEVYAGTNSKGEHTWKEGFDPEVEDWIKFNKLNTYFLESVLDFSWFYHAFPELIKNKRGDKIAQITHQEAAFCRFGLQNKAGYCDQVFINANWPNATAADPLTIPVTAVDPYELYQVQFVQNLRADKFIYPINYPTPGKVVYQTAMWHSIFPSGWFDISRLIPILKKALMQFTMTIKYLIEVPGEFWVKQAELQGKDWNELDGPGKKALQREVKKEMNKFLTGAENAGKSFMTTFGVDRDGKKIPGVTITPLADSIKDGKYIEDGKEAGGHFIRSFGIPVPLIGPISSGDMGAGSGSDARVQENIFDNRLGSRRDRLLEPLEFIADYNGWKDRLPGFRWRVRKFVLDTLDVNHSTTNSAPKQNAAA